MGTYSEEELRTLVRLIQQFEVNVEGTNSFEQAQVCCGGVSTEEVKEDTLESSYVPGVILPERYWMWMGSAADIICSGHGPADGLQEERQQMLRINQLKLKVGHSEEQLKKKLVRELKIRPEELQKFEIRRQSIDARKKPGTVLCIQYRCTGEKRKRGTQKTSKECSEDTGCVLSDAKNWKEKHRKDVRLL